MNLNFKFGFYSIYKKNMGFYQKVYFIKNINFFFFNQEEEGLKKWGEFFG